MDPITYLTARADQEMASAAVLAEMVQREELAETVGPAVVSESSLSTDQRLRARGQFPSYRKVEPEALAAQAALEAKEAPGGRVAPKPPIVTVARTVPRDHPAGQVQKVAMERMETTGASL